LLEFADRIAIMYAGEVVETAPAGQLGTNPQHPYTQGLLQSFPPLSGPRQRLTGIPGAPPDLRKPPSGCRFHPRCPHCTRDRAELYLLQTTERPSLREVEPGHEVACHLVAGADE
jgi:peptide/nickel transport system ATP-binding protein